MRYAEVDEGTSLQRALRIMQPPLDGYSTSAVQTNGTETEEVLHDRKQLTGLGRKVTIPSQRVWWSRAVDVGGCDLMVCAVAPHLGAGHFLKMVTAQSNTALWTRMLKGLNILKHADSGKSQRSIDRRNDSTAAGPHGECSFVMPRGE